MLSKCKKEEGVVSLEACIVLPIFIFLLMFLYGFMVFFSGHQAMSHALIQGSQSLSLDPYASNRLTTSWESTKNGSDLVEAIYAELLSSNEYFSSNEKWYDTSKGTELMHQTVRNRFLGYLVGSGEGDVEARADQKLKLIGVVDGVDGLDFSETKIENGVLTITVRYEQEFVFNFQGLASFERKQTVSITLWDVT